MARQPRRAEAILEIWGTGTCLGFPRSRGCGSDRAQRGAAVIALAVALALLAALLAGPVPAWLAGSAAAPRHPVAAVLAWQAIGAGTGFAAVGAGLALAASGSPVAGVGLVAGVALAGYLVTVTAWVTVRTLARRRSHRGLLDLVGTPIATLPGG